MGLISHVIAAGIGYYAGQPEGRRQLDKLRRQAVDYAHGPEAKRLRERGWDAAGEGALAARSFAWRTLGRKDASAGSTGDIADTRSRVLWRRSRPDQTTPPGPISPTPGATVPDGSTTSGPGSSGSPSTSPTSPSTSEKRP
jgi:hypothetical protein